MKKNVFHLCTAMFLTLGTLNAQETTEKVEKLSEVTVVATKFAIEKEKIGKVIYQITKEELANAQGKSVADVLDNLAGIQIFGNNSSAGKDKSAYVRGGRGYQTLVLIDGVPLSDPSGINNAFDLRLLTLNQIESIEIMNGASSTLYGSGAATGVVNIKLKEAVKKPIALHYQLAIGTNNSQDNTTINLNDFNQNIAINGSLNKFNYLVNVNASSISGMSDASDENSTTKFEYDKFKPTNTYVKLGYNFSEKLNVALFHNFDKDIYDYDGGAFTDSDINNGENKQSRFGFSSNLNYSKGNLKFIASYNQNNRFLDEYSSWTNSMNYYEYTGKSIFADVVNEFKFNNQFQLITGISYQNQRNQTNSPYGEIDEDLAKFNMLDPYATIVYNSKNGININAGARLNIHSEYGNHFVYNVNPSYNISNNFRLISSYSTAFISPSIYQLFSEYGNVNLNPEKDNSVEAGIIYKLNDIVELNTVFFYRNMEDAILFGASSYENANESINAKGVETILKTNKIHHLNISLGHTYTYKNADIDYIPKHKITAEVGTTSFKNTYLSLNFKHISKRTFFDQWGTGSTMKFDAYSLIDFYGSYSIIKNKVSVFAQVNNLFNEDFVEVLGYTTKGRNYKIGLDFNF
ncbi:TonB-dependent receptor plug domain-containing protein [Lutibacter maritimus]|uniref:Vitamin B12 transporter n=1 Tax=Lutibacter maritimus TaxID=593133 RepID=A0A1I6NY95_9FLAO|nr:TonB-dependent receptor [Lutibacter maritimus]SFS32845.1 vitamin B12 transporter [Lutibacter maritimus]